MRTSMRFSLLAIFAGFALLVGACSNDSTPPPEGLAFADESSSDTTSSTEAPAEGQDDGSGDTTTVAPETTTEAPETTVPGVNRPTNRTCSTSDYSVAFGESTVLIDATNLVAGPFSVAVPAGTYEITMSTWLGFRDEPQQTMEQWYFTTDSGYTSPLTTDSSPTLIYTDSFGAQTLGATTTVTLHHKGGTGVTNSVHPLCIGFRSVAAPATTAAPTTTTAAPTTTTAAPTTTQAADVESGEVAAPATTTTVAAAAPVADAAPAELALTGPGDLSMSLGLTGAALMLAGVATLTAARRSEED